MGGRGDEAVGVLRLFDRAGRIYCAAIFQVGSCECLSFASICCLVGGWLLGGIYSELSLMRGRKGELEGGREDIYVYVYIAEKNERDGRIERDVRAGSLFFLATFHNNNNIS